MGARNNLVRVHNVFSHCRFLFCGHIEEGYVTEVSLQPNGTVEYAISGCAWIPDEDIKSSSSYRMIPRHHLQEIYRIENPEDSED